MIVVRTRASLAGPSVLERDVVHAILRRYGADPRLRLWRNNVGLAQHGDRMVRYGLPGSSDILGITHTGRFVAIECKTERGQLSPQQRAFRAMVERMQGLYVLARSVTDVEVAIQAALPP